jgi:hypothetical protein
MLMWNSAFIGINKNTKFFTSTDTENNKGGFVDNLG